MLQLGSMVVQVEGEDLRTGELTNVVRHTDKCRETIPQDNCKDVVESPDISVRTLPQ